MRMTKLRLIGLTTIDLPVIGAATPFDNYMCKGIEGLGPPGVDVSIAQTVFASGVYQGRRPQNREIVATIGLNPTWSSGMSASNLRESLYGLLTPGVNDVITIQVMDGTTVVAQTQGYVKQFESLIFTKDPVVQVTFACLKPYLESPNTITPNLSGAGFRANPVITNPGTAPTGVHMEIVFSAGGTGWTLTRGTQKMQFDMNLLSGMRLIFDTRPGFRSISTVYSGVTTNMLNALSADSVWFELHGGVNNFTASPATYDWAFVYFLPNYWGI